MEGINYSLGKIRTSLGNKVDGKWIIYSSLSDLGLSAGTETINAIIHNMSAHSTLFLGPNSSYNTSEYPYAGGGIMTIHKVSPSRAVIDFTCYNHVDERWQGAYADSFFGWAKYNLNAT